MSSPANLIVTLLSPRLKLVAAYNSSITQTTDYQTNSSSNWTVYAHAYASISKTTNTLTFGVWANAFGSGSPPGGGLGIYLYIDSVFKQFASLPISGYKVYDVSKTVTFPGAGRYDIVYNNANHLLQFDVTTNGFISNPTTIVGTAPFTNIP